MIFIVNNIRENYKSDFSSIVFSPSIYTHRMSHHWLNCLVTQSKSVPVAVTNRIILFYKNFSQNENCSGINHCGFAGEKRPALSTSF